MAEMLFSNVQFCSGFVLLIFAVIQLVYRNKGLINYVLFGIYSAIAFTILYLWLFKTGLIGHFRYVIYHDITVTFIAGPLVFFYLRSILGMSVPAGRIVLINFIPAAISAVIITIINYFDPSLSAHYIASKIYLPDYSLNRIIWWGDKISNSSMLVYFVLSVIVISRFVRVKNIRQAPELWFLLGYMFSVMICAAVMLMSTLVNNDILLTISVTLLSLLGIVYFIVSFRFPGFTQKAIREARTIRVKSLVEENDSEEVIREMESLMHQKKLFTEESLSLQKTSEALGISTHLLSRIINEKTGMNFRNYLNSFRVREAKALLAEKPDMPVIEVAFATGFNSKSSFNEAFLKTTGVSPRDYRAALVKK